MKPFQKMGINFLKSKAHALLADEMGLGKTVQAIGGINAIDAKRALIVCPASLKLNWEAELHRWLQRSRKIYVVTKRSSIIPDNAEIIIVNYDLVDHSNIFYQLRDRDYDCIICDEAH